MKNLLIYIHPSKQFNGHDKYIVPIQIDNILKYSKSEDIILITNFPYEYKDIKAQVIEGLYCDVHTKASKINAIIYLLENNLLEGLIWFHDFDAFQINSFDIKLEKDIGFTDYGWSPKWNTGSIFFKPTKSALEVFKWLKDAVYQYKTDEERALGILTVNNFNNINSKYQRLNPTYNFGTRRFDERYAVTEKPIKVLHFHLHRRHHIEELKDVIPDYLIKMFYERPYRNYSLIKALYKKSSLNNKI